MRHFLFIDPLEKLNIKKDSSLMLALNLKMAGVETFVFFKNDFSVNNLGAQKVRVYDFNGQFVENSFYLKSFVLRDPKIIELNESDIIHMRLDPPFDSRYLRTLWMLDHWVSMGIKVMNSPRGIMNFNEKLYAYRTSGAVSSFVGESWSLAKEFVTTFPFEQEFILKPLDLYSGIGVEKISSPKLENRFREKVKELDGPIVLQPFVSAVSKGEMRTIYFKGKELGSILKIPKTGEFLSNIAQGAAFHKIELKHDLKNKCDEISNELASFGVDWIAFDILEDAITEVNITCPGLLVEVSHAHQKNLALEIIQLMNLN